MSNSVNSKPRRPRNPLAHHPLMRKGGAHKKSTKALRRAGKVELKREHAGETPFLESDFSSMLGQSRMNMVN